jgi:DNA primase
MAEFLDTFITNSNARVKVMADWADPPYAYLQSRGVTDDDIDRFDIGYFEGDLDVRDESQDFHNFNEKTRFGRRMQQRLFFPLTNARGMNRGFESRNYVGEKSYFKYTVLRNNVDAWFFGLKQAMEEIWETRTAFLAEGIFDLFPLARIWPNSICAATVNINPQQMEFFQRYLDTLYVVLDEDVQGEKQFFRLRKQLPNLDVIRLHVPAKDLSELWTNMGEDGFRRQLLKEYECRKV